MPTPNIHRYVKVVSKNIAGVGYDPVTATLDIIFAQDLKMMYRYQNVTPSLMANVLFAPSIGQAFHRLIKNEQKSFPWTVHDAPELK